MPHLGSSITREYQDTRVVAIPHLRRAAISIIDMSDWSLLKTLETDGPGFFMRSHENSRYAWASVFFGPHRDRVHIIDKQKLEITRTLTPEPGKTAAHVEFDRYGEKALLSIREDDGALSPMTPRPWRKSSASPCASPRASTTSGTRPATRKAPATECPKKQ
jgi:hypothetical protein